MGDYNDDPFTDPERLAGELLETCHRCDARNAETWDGLCRTCVHLVRREAEVGTARLGRYLASWAAFNSYLATH